MHETAEHSTYIGIRHGIQRIQPHINNVSNPHMKVCVQKKTFNSLIKRNFIVIRYIIWKSLFCLNFLSFHLLLSDLSLRFSACFSASLLVSCIHRYLFGVRTQIIWLLFFFLIKTDDSHKAVCRCTLLIRSVVTIQH